MRAFKPSRAMLVALLMLGVSTPAHAASNIIRTENGGVAALGAWNLKTDHTYHGARAAFGRPATFRRVWDMPLCAATWRRPKLEITFDLKHGRCGAVQVFTVSERTWRTDRGLRIGDPTGRVPQLYPQATFSATEWDLGNDVVSDHNGEMDAVPKRGLVHHFNLVLLWW